MDSTHHDDEHAVMRSRLESSGFRMVTQFPLDVMHQIDLGVAKTILLNIKHRETLQPLTKEKLREMDKILIGYSDWTPKDFARKPCSLKELPSFKATECRQFILYYGIVLLKHFLPDNQYKHFLLLSCSYRILSSSAYKDRLDECDALLEIFVENFQTFYLKLGYNVHNLLHITDCVRNFGSVNNFSAYKFENYMGTLNRLIRGKREVLTQVYNRLIEFNRLNIELEEEEPVKRPYDTGQRNSYVGLKDYSLCKIIGIKGGVFSVQKYTDIRSFFVAPMCSEEVGVFLVGHLEDTINFVSEDTITDKYYCLPYNNEHVLISIL